MSTELTPSIEAAFEALRAAFEGRADPPAPERRGFGSKALTAKGRVFALVASSGRFVVKLPKAQVARLTGAGLGEPWDGGKGRPMKEWLAVASGREAEWPALADDAFRFVSGEARP
ncbi:MAG: hypothetical protein ACREEW_19300 [Caulobacteraceae bacterium]